MAQLETRQKAIDLLAKIQNYWREQGYDVQGAIIEGDYNERLRSKVYEVRTNLVGGKPPANARIAA